jgi:amino acid adenylation domain-containing protein
MTADAFTSGEEAIVLPASCSQQRLWFLDHLQPGSAAYNLPRAVRLEGPLDAAVLERALAEVVARHESLRTTFASEDGVAVQVIAPALPMRLPVEDLSAWPEAEREAALARTLAATASAPFELGKGPLVRARLVRLRPDVHIFVVAASHIVADGLSISLLFKELSALYAAFAAGQPSPLPPVATQFSDYALAERERLTSGELERHLGYWREQLSGELPATELPPDRARLAAPTRRGSLLHARLATREGAAALAALCREEKTSPFSALLAAFALLLQRHTGHDDVLVGSPFGNRSRAEGEGPAGPRFQKWLMSIGFYAATVVLRVDLGGEPAPTFRELVRRARAIVEGASAHVDLPFEKLVEAMRPAREAGANPFFQIMLSYLAAPDLALALPGVTVTPIDVSHGSSMFDLLVQLEDARDGLEGYFTYSTELYDEETIARFAANFADVVTRAVAAPDLPASRIAVPADAERRRVLVEWNQTAVEATPACLHVEVSRRAALSPARVAVRSGDRALTYDELDRRANRLARRLQGLGVGPDRLVGICLPRGPELVVAVLATLKAGGAYLPLDPVYPARRLAQMLEDSQAGVVVTTSSLAGGLPLGAARAVCLDAEADALASGDDAAPASDARPEHLAYVIYTSGSTGAPKGVMVEHRQASSFFAAMDRVLDEGRAGRAGRADVAAQADPGVWLAATSLSFDISVLELLWTLTRGFTVVVEVPEDADADRASAFAASVAAYGVTHFQCTPSMATLLVAEEASRAALRALDVMLVGGEALSPALAGELVAALRGDLFNMYGPTETTIWSTTWRVPREAFSGASPPAVSIGRPIANTTVYLLDARREPVPIGVAGELYIGGAGVTRGYLFRPELTDERFVANPFGDGRLYRTGDLARHRADGTIEFLGRVDHQVKIRGHRIELGEIELALREASGAREVVVVARPSPFGQPEGARLVAYLAGAAAPPPATELRRILRERLPEPMVPSAFVVLEALPHTPNGKIDRKALPSPEEAAAATGDGAGADGLGEVAGEGFVAPRTPTEQVVAEIWREVLGVPRVSIYDNFFDLGGHSLLSPRVMHHLEMRLKKRLNVSELILQNLSQVAAKCDRAPEVEAPRARGVLGALKRMIAR